MLTINGRMHYFISFFLEDPCFKLPVVPTYAETAPGTRYQESCYESTRPPVSFGTIGSPTQRNKYEDKSDIIIAGEASE
jgi:hypothetical protein